MFSVVNLLFAALLFATPAVAKPVAAGASDEKPKYEVRVTGNVTQVTKVGDHAFIVFVDKGANDGVKLKTMSVHMKLESPSATIEVMKGTHIVSPGDFNEAARARPQVLLFRSDDTHTAFFLWTHHADIEKMRAETHVKGGTFTLPEPKVGDVVEFVAAPKPTDTLF
ncbi:hypothetical protein K8I61_03375 [bacterium]|nr:hypothetical protein [bacterium]